MLLRDFMARYELINNTYGIFERDILNTRIKARYSMRTVRDDLTSEEILSNVQNVVDINKDYWRNLFAQTVNPWKTWGETGENSGNGGTTITEELSINTTDNMKHTGNDSTDNNLEVSVTGKGNNTNLHSVNAFDSVEMSEDSKDEQTAENSNTTKTTGGVKTIYDSGTNATGERSENKTGATQTIDSGQYNKGGWNIDDYLKAIDKYNALYDIIIDEIAPYLLNIVIDIEGVRI